MDKKKKRSERDDESSYSSSSSSSSSDTVLISKPLNQKSRKKLQAQLQQQESARQAAADESVAATATTTIPTTTAQERASGKSDLICLVCEQDGDLHLCTGPCVSAFHLECLGVKNELSVARDAWKCPSCTSSTHVCFHCKRLGASVNPETAAGTGVAPSAQQPATANADGLRPVRKCRALSCGKFYHSDCIAKLPLARIAGSNFICPLHTCAACEQSGAKKESVRCMRCPVAYHTSCLPKNCVQNFPGKRIICPKHEGSSSHASASAAEVSLSSRPQVETEGKDKKPPKEAKPSKTHGSERGDADKARSAGDRLATEDEDKATDTDVKTEVSGTTSSSKKLSKSAKREKKKKKKKRKKAKKRDSKERGHGDDEDEEESASAKAVASRTDSDDDDDDGRNTKSHAEGDVKRENPYDLPALNVPYPDAVSPATSSSLFESPATTNERIKARLVEALGQSDDDVESLGSSPIAFPKARAVWEAEVGAESPAKSPGSPVPADSPPQSPQQGLENVKYEASSALPEPPVHPNAKEPSAVTQPPSVATSTRNARAAAGDESRQSGNEYSSDSQSSGENKVKVRNEQSPPPSSSDLSRQPDDASDRNASKKQQHGYGGLSLQIPGSPGKSGVDSPAVAESLTAVGKDGGISEGEEGDDEGPGGSSTPTLRRRASTGGSGTPRGDATDDLKGKATTSSRFSKKKKKKKTKSSSEPAVETPRVEPQGGEINEGGAVVQEEKDEAKWVQCDSCKKWRTVPKHIDLNSMPERWYCKMNTWDSVFASCGVAEEAVSTMSKKPKSGSHAKKSKVKIKSKPQADAQEGVPGAISDGGASSPSSGSGSQTSKKASSELEGSGAGDKSKLAKKQEKQAKKRKLKLKLKEKYREVKWVQCESSQCGKWRVVPSSIDFNLLPAVWYCHLNTWTPELAKCTAPNPPEVEAFLMKSRSKKGGSSSSSGSRPSKKLKPTGEAPVFTPTTTVPAAALSLAGASDVPAKPPKPAKAPKSGATPSTPATAQPGVSNSAPDVSSAGAVSSAVAVAGGSTPSAHPGASTGGAVVSSAHPGSHNQVGISNNSIGGGKGRKVKPDGIKKTVLEWAQCEKCNKWRKLPQHIKSSTLPDKWYCSMNHWDPVRASCSIPEEVDQEPLGASPLPSSQNWYPMPGQVSGNGGSGAGGIRSKRSKLSYTELLYAGTGQLRKTYTSESSTLTFELGGRTYQRDDQYKASSMYVSPDSMVNASNAGKRAGDNAAISFGSDSSKQQSKASSGTAEDPTGYKFLLGDVVLPNQPSVEQVATLVLDAMDLRRSSTIVGLLRAVNEKDAKSGSEPAFSLALVAAAVSHLVQKGLVEKQDSEHEFDEHFGADDEDAAARVGSKRRKSTGALHSSSSAAFQYRKVPKRPLKASKCWRLGQSAFEFPLKD